MDINGGHSPVLESSVNSDRFVNDIMLLYLFLSSSDISLYSFVCESSISTEQLSATEQYLKQSLSEGLSEGLSGTSGTSAGEVGSVGSVGSSAAA